MTLDEYDRSLGIEGLCGVDEAGRGPLAGDVYAAAVILDPDHPIEGLNDSKKLTEKKREALYPVILEKAAAWSVGVATVEEIETYNILQATFLAMRRAVTGLSVPPALVLVDGNRNPGLELPTRLLVKGDGTSACVAAASTRDLVCGTTIWRRWQKHIRSISSPGIRDMGPSCIMRCWTFMESRRFTAILF